MDYAESLLTRDLRDIANIQRQDVMRSLLDVLAAWSGKLMDVAGICGKLAISRKTVESYINSLLTLHLFEKLPPWLQTDYDRVGRREKIFATDTGLMANLLQWRLDDVLLDADRSGKIVETFVFNELAAQIDLYDGYRFYHYRDRLGREIDFIVENDRGELLGIEVKVGSSFSSDDCRHMVWFKNNIVPDKPFTGIVLHSGQDALPLGENMYAVPIAALWE
jgi:predicted AAA+ superfamily ATPase